VKDHVPKKVIKRKTPKMKVSIGGDPEFFVRKNGENISAHDLVPGTKRNPHKLPSGGDVQADGTAIEFNIKPSFSDYEFADNIARCLRNIRRFCPKKEFDFRFDPVVVYKKNYFDKLPDLSKELGCDPDFNAYTGKMNNPPKNNSTMRTGAGHITIGWTHDKDPHDRSHFWDCMTLTKNLDKYFQHFSPLWDHDTQRRRMYGELGAFRPKPFGLEYRVLSNAWLRYPRLWPWIFNSAKAVFDATLDGKTIILSSAPMNNATSLAQKVRLANAHFVYKNGIDFPALPEDFNGNSAVY
jgi:hypothetical protein